MRILLAS